MCKPCSIEETTSTLRYADRAKKIKNKPIVNQDPRVAGIINLKKKIQELKSAMFNQENGGGKYCSPEHSELAEKNQSFQRKLRGLRETLNANLTEMVHMHERTILEECENLLKDQDRKRLNQITQMQAEHNRQKNVFKRKMEEAQAINKRLQETNEKLKVQVEKYRESNSEKDKLLTELQKKCKLYNSRKPKPKAVASAIYKAEDSFISDIVDEDENDLDWSCQKLKTVRNVGCKCKKNCSSRLCSCRKNDVTCSNCNCNPAICTNRNSNDNRS